MRVFKKIMYIILALVPILPLLLFSVGNIGNTNGVSVIPFGSFVIGRVPFSDDQVGTMIFVERDTIFDYILGGVIPSNDYVQRTDVSISIDDEESEYIHSALGVPYGDYTVYTAIENYTGDMSYASRFIGKIAVMNRWFTEIGISPPPYVVFIFAYLCYMLFIHIAFMIFDIIVFVPKKISEILEGV